MHSVPDTSGEALSRAQQAIFEGRMRRREDQARDELSPAAPLYDFLRDLGALLENQAHEIRAAHDAIDPEVVPMVSTTQGDPRLEIRVAALMAKGMRVSELLVEEAEIWRALARALDMDVLTLHARVRQLRDGATPYETSMAAALGIVTPEQVRADFKGAGKHDDAAV